MLASRACTNQTNLMEGFVSQDATTRAPAASDFIWKAKVGWVFFLLCFGFYAFS